MEQQLGVSDNELPGGKKSGAGNAGALLSSYDQSILAGGPPQTGDGASCPSPVPLKPRVCVHRAAQSAGAGERRKRLPVIRRRPAGRLETA
jgi:hypothetical protein